METRLAIVKWMKCGQGSNEGTILAVVVSRFKPSKGKIRKRNVVIAKRVMWNETCLFTLCAEHMHWNLKNRIKINIRSIDCSNNLPKGITISHVLKLEGYIFTVYFTAPAISAPRQWRVSTEAPRARGSAWEPRGQNCRIIMTARYRSKSFHLPIASQSLIILLLLYIERK